MIQEQERAEKFFRAMQRDAERRRKEIAKQVDSYTAAETERVQVQAERAARHQVEYESRRIEAETNRRLAKAAGEASAALAACRAAITRDVMDRVAEKVQAFTHTPDYKSWLEASLKELSAALGGEITVFARPDDAAQVEALAKALGLGVQVQTDETIRLGGLRAASGRRRADDTLDSRLAGQEDWFYQNAGLSIAIE